MVPVVRCLQGRLDIIRFIKSWLKKMNVVKVVLPLIPRVPAIEVIKRISRCVLYNFNCIKSRNWQLTNTLRALISYIFIQYFNQFLMLKWLGLDLPLSPSSPVFPLDPNIPFGPVSPLINKTLIIEPIIRLTLFLTALLVGPVLEMCWHFQELIIFQIKLAWTYFFSSVT